MSPAIRRDSAGRRPTGPNPPPKERSQPLLESDRLEALLRERYRLTRGEAQVARHVADGLTYAEIAAVLGVSYHTVHSHVKAIHLKTSVTSNGKLMALLRNELRL